MKNKESRAFAGLELRNLAEGGIATLVGMAAMYNKQSEDLGGFREVIAPGAFGDVNNLDLVALAHHDTARPLARTGAGLTVNDTEEGLEVEINLIDNADGNTVRSQVDAGLLGGMSFGFFTTNDNWDEVDGVLIRTLLEVELFEVSPVTWPAYPDTSIAMRGLGHFRDHAEPTVSAATLRTKNLNRLGLKTRGF